MDPLTSINPLDGRYLPLLSNLDHYFSEFAYYSYRVKLECLYVIYLAKENIIGSITSEQIRTINSFWQKFDLEEAKKIKNIEDKVRHDIKAIEYYLQSKFREHKLTHLIPSIHFGLTSDDINNLAYGLMLKESNQAVLIPELKNIFRMLRKLIDEGKAIPILGRTHGQPAVPTTFGKEMVNFYKRLEKQANKLENFIFEGKLTGAVGNFNALDFVFPRIDWIAKSKKFVSSLGLSPNIFTTQILPYDNWIEYFQNIYLINRILVNLCQDIWLYITLEDLKLKVVEKEVGSSTMPQKVNPIDFENAEGNLQTASNLFQFLQNKLSVSRLQRDLSDSPVKRNIGTAIGYTLVGWKSLQKGLSKIEVNTTKTANDLNSHWEILTEAVQTHLRLKNDLKAYDKVKELVRGRQMSEKDYLDLLKHLGLDKEEKLTKLKPENYLGLAKRLAKQTKY